MSYLLAFLLVAICLRHFLIWKSLKQIARQLRSVRESSRTNQLIKNPSQSKELERLVMEINLSLKDSRNKVATYEEKEQQIREQIVNISHDLRTPLAAIKGYFELMETANDEEMFQYLEMIRRRADLLQALLDNYYDLAKIQSKEQAFFMESVNPKELLGEVVASFYYDFVETDMEVRFEESPDFWVLADKELLNRVLMNLVQNVLKHGTGFCQISQKALSTRIENRIKGDLPDAKRVFERLYSADASRTGGNSGLGLTTAKLLLEQMGHEVSAAVVDDVFVIEIFWKE